MTTDREEKARQRAEVIMKVCSGVMTATEGAEALQVSRKTFYEWENDGLAAFVEALKDGDPGRPQKKEDPEKAALEQELKDLKRVLAVAKQTVEVRRMLALYEQHNRSHSNGSDITGKKNRKSKKK